MFWLGDLNYRLADLDCGEVKELLAEGNIAVLQEQVDGGVMVSSTHPQRSSEIPLEILRDPPEILGDPRRSSEILGDPS